MKYHIFISLTAQKDEAESYQYYEGQSQGLGNRFLDEVETALTKIAAHPNQYSYTDSTKTLRELSLQHFPFIIIYFVIDDNIVVTNIHHTSKQST